MANICSVTMYFYGKKSAVEDLHAKCQRWMDTFHLVSYLRLKSWACNESCKPMYGCRCQSTRWLTR